jgi:hypothetical protein
MRREERLGVARKGVKERRWWREGEREEGVQLKCLYTSRARAGLAAEFAVRS